MKYDNRHAPEFDTTDLAILELLQENCKQPLAAIGAKVGLKAPSVNERIHKLEEAGVITGYVALLEGRRLGKEVSAFIGLSTDRPRTIGQLEREVAAIDDIQECHHVTGSFTLIIKVKTQSTESLERLIEQIRALDGVARTETMVVLSTSAERPRIALSDLEESPTRPTRRSGARERRSAR
ncbi:MAG: Lrp/AsnC family transcriptional regulator [Myxococcota bacterium]